MTDIREVLDEIAARSRQKIVPQDEIDALVAALRAVLDLHHETVDGLCASCFEPDVQTGEALVVFYPCPTVQAITEALGGDA